MKKKDILITRTGNGSPQKGIYTIKIKFKRAGGIWRCPVKKSRYLGMVRDSRTDKKNTRIRDGYPYWKDAMWEKEGIYTVEYSEYDYNYDWWKR